ncbi:rhodanese-like domain-containing protein [Inquilinus sp. KBS0705]|nr:rhodanese-like domain-containing protein [Inquilinus sp. KBS0705]
MKKQIIILTLSLFVLILTNKNVQAQTSATPITAGISVPWTDNQLIEPAELDARLKDDKATQPIIFNIGAVEDIKFAKHIGAVNNTENLGKLKAALAGLPKSTAIVIYCGCCPYTKCPNIRPAFFELQKEGFANIKVLNLPTNLHTNWTSKGYPMADK